MPQQFDNQDPAPSLIPLRSQRMTAEETRSVIDLWQQEQTQLTDRPAVPDVAEGLNVSVEDVQRLLAAVREKRAEEERALAYEQGLAHIRLAEAHRTLAEEERKLAEVRRQRADLARERPAGAKYVKARPLRVEAEPLPWEEAKLFLPVKAENPFPWTETELSAWEDETEDESVEAYQSESARIARVFGSLTLFCLFLFVAFWLLSSSPP